MSNSLSSASKTSHLGRAISVLEAAAYVDGVTLADLVSTTKLPRSTVHRLARELVELNVLAYDEHQRLFRIGARALTIAFEGLQSESLERRIGAPLSRIATEVQETAIIARLQGFNVTVFLARTPSDSGSAHIAPPLGTRPRHTCSTSRAIFAFQSSEVIVRLLSEKPERFTGKTIISPKALASELATVRERGYAVCDEEIDVGVKSIAAPVHLPWIGAAYSVGVVGPAARMRERDDDWLGRMLAKKAAELAEIIQSGPEEGLND